MQKSVNYMKQSFQGSKYFPVDFLKWCPDKQISIPTQHSNKKVCILIRYTINFICSTCKV
jgi:hypothetical protein